MADGNVGRAILDFLLRIEPAALVALVTTTDGQTKPKDHPLPSTCRGLSWDFARSDDGVKLLRETEMDVLILAWWPYILKGSLLSIAPIILNTHPSYLPYCRGKDPNFWAIVEGCPFGVTIHHVDAGIDSGDIAFQPEIEVVWEDNGGSLYKKSTDAMVSLMKESLPTILYGDIPRLPQQRENHSFNLRSQLEPASRLSLDDQMSVRDLLNRLRARTFQPHPACRFSDGDEEFEVRVEITRIK